MRSWQPSEWVERLLFSAMVMGVLLAAGGGWRYIELSGQLAGNMAAQIQAEGGEVALESQAQAQGLMASDIERRGMIAEQFQAMVIGGGGLALLGLGWIGYDILRSRRRSASAAQA